MSVPPAPNRRCRATAPSAPRRLRKATKSEKMSRQATVDATTPKPPVRRTSTAPSAQSAMQIGRLRDAKVHFPPMPSPLSARKRPLGDWHELAEQV